MLSSEHVRANLDRLAKERGFTHSALARAIGRNRAYVQQFIARGTPARLAEADRRMLASMLGVDEHELGGGEKSESEGDLIQIRRLAVEASAGPGSIVDQEAALGQFGFPRLWLRQLTSAKSSELSIIRVKGDSMAPTLYDRDEALVDGSQRNPKREDGVYVLRREDALMVKRLTLTPGSRLITISSDNPAHPTWRDCPADTLEVVGRVIASVRPIA